MFPVAKYRTAEYCFKYFSYYSSPSVMLISQICAYHIDFLLEVTVILSDTLNDNVSHAQSLNITLSFTLIWFKFTAQMHQVVSGLVNASHDILLVL